MRALVADTSMVMRKVLVGALNRAGIVHVDQTADGGEVVELLATESYHLVLMDTQLQKLHGLDVLRAVREKGSRVPVILVTAEGERSLVMDALKAGANAYVIKPVEPQLLVMKIVEVLAKATQPGQ